MAIRVIVQNAISTQPKPNRSGGVCPSQLKHYQQIPHKHQPYDQCNTLQGAVHVKVQKPYVGVATRVVVHREREPKPPGGTGQNSTRPPTRVGRACEKLWPVIYAPGNGGCPKHYLKSSPTSTGQEDGTSRYAKVWKHVCKHVTTPVNVQWPWSRWPTNKTK